MKHVAALTALFAPTVNCYRQLHTAGVPNYANWGIENRLTSIRVKNRSEKSTYLEFRLSSGPANPYLVLACMIVANRWHCQQVEVTSDERSILPNSLPDSMKALEADKAIVDALGLDFVDWWCQMKQETEVGFLPLT